MIGNLKAVKRFTFGTDKTWSAVLTVTAPEQTVNAPGTIAGRFYLIQKPTYQTGLDYNPVARCDSDGVLTVQFNNTTAGSLTPTASEAWVGVCLDLEIDASQNDAST